MKMPRGDGMKMRFITAFTLIPIVVMLVWLPWLWLGFVALVAALVWLGAREFFIMARSVGIEAPGRVGALMCVCLTLVSGLAGPGDYRSHGALILSLFVLAVVHLFTLRHTIAGLSASVFALMYAGYSGSFFLALHQRPVIGPALITILVFTIGCSDTGAYLIGKAIGRHKLAPKVSPNKTVEGCVAALCSGALAGAFLCGLKTAFGWQSYPDWPLVVYAVIGVCLSIVGQIGDLMESLLKRDAGIKDSGSVFPGHGGALDRCDAFLFGAPALYCLVACVESLLSVA